MNRFRLAIALLLLLPWILAHGFLEASRASDLPVRQKLILLYSNDVNGETEPCG